jgi:hypothetical protein
LTAWDLRGTVGDAPLSNPTRGNTAMKTKVAAALLSGIVLVGFGTNGYVRATAQESTQPSAEAQVLIDKAQKAIDAAGPAAKEAFEVQVGKPIVFPINNSENVRIVHKATGMVCGVSADTVTTIKVYRKDDQGHAIDVSCDMVLRNTAQTLYAFQRPGSSVAKELDNASFGITTLYPDAVLQPGSPLDTFQDMNRFLTLRDYQTIKGTVARAFVRPGLDPRGFYESAWVGQKDNWYILQRSSGPAYWNWMAGSLWHDTWYNMLPDQAEEEMAEIRSLLETREKADDASQSSAN